MNFSKRYIILGNKNDGAVKNWSKSESPARKERNQNNGFTSSMGWSDWNELQCYYIDF